MKNLTHNIAVSQLLETQNLDCIPQETRIENGKLVGFQVLLTANNLKYDIAESLQRICGSDYQYYSSDVNSDNFEVSIVAKDHLKDQGGIFYKSIINLLGKIVESGFEFHNVSNIYA